MENKLFYLFMLSALVGVARSDLCAPSCANNTVPPPSEGAKVPDPTDCYQYYLCSDTNDDGNFEISLNPIECPSGDYFDRETRSCTVIPANGDAKCTDMCNPCDLSCVDPGTVLPDPMDCTKYYVCLSTGTLATECALGEKFDYPTGTCLPKDEAVCYELCDLCVVYCIEEGRIPDPQDCRSYYYCEPNEGLAHFNCVEEQYYDIAEKMCVNGTTCEKSCPDDPSDAPMFEDDDY